MTMVLHGGERPAFVFVCGLVERKYFGSLLM